MDGNGKKAFEKDSVETMMKSPNERVAQWYGVLSDAGHRKLEFIFGDLDQPVTDIMWLLAGKFLHGTPQEWF